MSVSEPRQPRSKLLLIGCGAATVMLLLCGGALTAIYFGARGTIEAVQEQERFARQWRAPSPEAPPESFAPALVAGFELQSVDEQAEFPALGIEHSGTHAVYTRDGKQIDVSVYRMTEAEKSATYDELLRRINEGDRFRTRSNVRLPRTLRFSVSPPDLRGSLWHSQDWMVFVRSSDVEDLEPFKTAYLEAIAGDD